MFQYSPILGSSIWDLEYMYTFSKDCVHYAHCICWTTTIREKIVGTPDAIYYNYHHAYHWSRKRGMALFNRKQRFSLLPQSFPTHQINVGGSGKVSDNMTWINIALGGRGHFFLLNQTKCINIILMIVATTNRLRTTALNAWYRTFCR